MRGCQLEGALAVLAQQPLADLFTCGAQIAWQLLLSRTCLLQRTECGPAVLRSGELTVRGNNLHEIGN